MTTAELLALSDDELNRMAATDVMGWRTGTIGINAGMWVDGDGVEKRWAASTGNYGWLPAIDYNDAAMVRKEIERQGLQSLFAHNLAVVVKSDCYLEPSLVTKWKIANASPRQICVAAIAAKGGAT